MLNSSKNLFASLAVPLLLLMGAQEEQAGPSLLVYDFNIGMGPVGNINYVESLGFDGIVTRVEAPADLMKLREYGRRAIALQGFDLLAFVPYDFSDQANSQVWRDALPILRRLETPLWVIIRNAPSAADLRQLLAEMASESQAAGIETVIYPHWNTDIESADDAAALIQEIGHPNLLNSLHTCHEIREGNQYSLDAVVAEHASSSGLVTIAGASEDAYSGPFVPGTSWSDAIQPLEPVHFDLLPFVQQLHDSGYDGPVILHTFGITNDPGHLERSIRKYADYLEQVDR